MILPLMTEARGGPLGGHTLLANHGCRRRQWRPWGAGVCWQPVCPVWGSIGAFNCCAGEMSFCPAWAGGRQGFIGGSCSATQHGAQVRPLLPPAGCTSPPPPGLPAPLSLLPCSYLADSCSRPLSPTTICRCWVATARSCLPVQSSGAPATMAAGCGWSGSVRSCCRGSR
jgi:hypothetical protein